MTEIDVSGCEHCKHIYKNGEGECAAYFLENGDSTVSCSEIPNCYYRQLKRLEQENAELKNRLKTLDDEEFVYEVSEIEYNNFKKMNDYKQALKEIKKISKIAFAVCDDDCGNANKFIDIINKVNEVLKDE